MPMKQFWIGATVKEREWKQEEEGSGKENWIVIEAFGNIVYNIHIHKACCTVHWNGTEGDNGAVDTRPYNNKWMSERVQGVIQGGF